MRRFIDHAQQPVIDRVAIGQKLVQIHRAHDGADIGHGEVENGVFKVRNLIGRLRGVQNLVECDAVNGDGRIVLGDDFLRRHIQHLLHHVELGADTVDEGRDEIETGRQRLGEASEALDSVIIALRHGLDAGEQDEQHENNQNGNDNVKALHGTLARIRRQ